MMGLSIDDVRRIAHLARLDLTEAEAARLPSDMDRIVQFVAQLQSVSTDGVEPLSTALDRCNSWRDDQLAPSLPREQVLAQAPRQDGECFLVPPVL
jgi:aspartyl-tRNA(Asn)/glutamyl-tRNA(Gln) amidotransferase subunit C